MVTHMNRNQTLATCEENRERALAYFKSHLADNGTLLGGMDSSESLADVNRVEFGVAMCAIFQARVIARCFTVRSAEQAQSPAYKQAFEDAAGLITTAKMNLDPHRWLTFQYELGYSNLDIGAAQEAKTWFETFIQALDTLERTSKVTKHWKKMRKQAREKLKLVPKLEMHQQKGFMP
jgi:hypothetical protein